MVYNKITNQSSAPTTIGDILFLGERDGVNKVFTVVDPFVIETSQIYFNGILQEKMTDYVLSNTTSIEFNYPIFETDKLSITYH